MKYYNEETVRQIVKDAMEYGMSISQTLPMDIKHYPNIEIKEPHGRLGDLDELEDNAYDDASWLLINSAPTIVEAST